jgi:hypothetical protein
MLEKYISDYRRILRLKLERESEHLHISSAEIKNAWSFIYSLPSYAFMAS